MPCTAKLRTLSKIDAWLRDRQRLFVQTAGDGIKLEPKRWYGKSVDDVCGGCLNADRNARWHNHTIVYGHQLGAVIFSTEAVALGSVALLFEHVGHNFKAAMVRISVTPIPLIASCLNGHGVCWCWLELLRKQVERWVSNAEKDEDWDQRPNDLNEGIVRRL